jgi:hypothetical protein
MLSVTFSYCYAECLYYECSYAECRYAECRSTFGLNGLDWSVCLLQSLQFHSNLIIVGKAGAYLIGDS